MTSAASVMAAGVELRFADVLTDNMVLQRGKDIQCWGTAEPGSEVEVLLTQSREEIVKYAGESALSRNEHSKMPAQESNVIGKVRVGYIEDEPAAFKSVVRTVTADKDGRWQVGLGEHAASFTPTYLAAKAGGLSVVIQNMLIGEVWIASGQSNMEWAWTQDKMWENKGLLFNGVRYAKVRGASAEPTETFSNGKGAFEPWIVCEDGSVDRVSSIPYLFAQYLHRRLKVPVGIINIAQGGSFAREWCSREVLEGMASPTVDAQLAKYDIELRKNDTADWRSAPTELYNGRLYPIRQMAVAGVIYLQGENEALCGDLPQYVKTFPGVIESYRKAFGRPDLPFGIITLQGGGGAYCVAREIHYKTHQQTPNTGYIVAHDIGDGIHPAVKRPLAERAVYWALRDVYKVLDGVSKTRMKEVSFEGRDVLVEFESVQYKGGAWNNAKAQAPGSNDQKDMRGFTIAGEDRIWYSGRIIKGQAEGSGIRVSHPLVSKPVALRYGWDGDAPGNIGSWEDPVPPFRSDDWPIVLPDEIVDRTAGEMSSGEVNYARSIEDMNRALELDLRVAIADSAEQLTKRYAYPKGILISTVESMQTLAQNFDEDRYEELAPGMRQNALYNIPFRYWSRDKYTPERRVKWGWLLERVIRLKDLPEEMEKTLGRKDVAKKIVKLQEALKELADELEDLPDPEEMDFDTLLDRALPVMDKERENLEAKGVTVKGGAYSKNPF